MGVLYENIIQQTLIEFKDENKKMYKVVARLSAQSTASVCRYYDHCPVRDELQKSAG